MRQAILISFAAFGLTFSVASEDAPAPLVRITLGSRSGYIVSEKYAEACKADLVASIPGPVKIDGFWTPSEQDAVVADRVFRELLQSAVKDPTVLFPDLPQNGDPDSPDSLEHQQNELVLVAQNYDRYVRQYVGVIIDGNKLVFCNYSVGTKVDPWSDYIFIHKVFVPDGTVHFLQCRFDPEWKTCANVSIIGSWQPKEK